MKLGELRARLEEWHKVLGDECEVRLMTLTQCPIDAEAVYIVESDERPGHIMAVPGREGAAMHRDMANRTAPDIMVLYAGYWSVVEALDKAKANRTKIRKRVAAGADAGHETHLAHADGLVDGLESALELLKTGGK
jgi:hypothetical protein